MLKLITTFVAFVSATWQSESGRLDLKEQDPLLGLDALGQGAANLPHYKCQTADQWANEFGIHDFKNQTNGTGSGAQVCAAVFENYDAAAFIYPGYDVGYSMYTMNNYVVVNRGGAVFVDKGAPMYYPDWLQNWYIVNDDGVVSFTGAANKVNVAANLGSVSIDNVRAYDATEISQNSGVVTLTALTANGTGQNLTVYSNEGSVNWVGDANGVTVQGNTGQVTVTGKASEVKHQPLQECSPQGGQNWTRSDVHFGGRQSSTCTFTSLPLGAVLVLGNVDATSINTDDSAFLMTESRIDMLAGMQAARVSSTSVEYISERGVFSAGQPMTVVNMNNPECGYNTNLQYGCGRTFAYNGTSYGINR